MGDWIDRWHWIACAHEQAALQVYDRLEHAAIDYRKHGDASLRFGFASPRLIVALAVRKWGEDTTLYERITRSLPASGLVRAPGDWLVGNLDDLETEHAFAWTPDRVVDAALERAGLPAVQVGTATVRAIDRDAVFERVDRLDNVDGPDGSMWRARTPPVLEHGEASIVVGVVSRAHGLVQLGHAGRYQGFTAVAMPLWASRIAGAGNWNVVRDDVVELPSTRLFDDLAWRFERHGPHVLWQSRDQRARWVRDARASASATERLAGSLMERRWGFVRARSQRREDDRWWHAGPDTLAVDRLPDTPDVRRLIAALDGDLALSGALRFTQLAGSLAELIGRHDPRLRDLAIRFAEVAHAVSRSSYWMVRDGAPRADLPDDAPGPRPSWDGDPGSVASAIDFWTWCALRASRHEHPARAAAGAFIALEAAIDRATGVWWIPPRAWIEALLHAEIAGDSDAGIDPTVHENTELDPAAARVALAAFVDGEAALRQHLPVAVTSFEVAYRGALAAGAPVLALRARLGLLQALRAIGEHVRFTELGNELLRDLPSPIAMVHFSTAGELAERALRWTASKLAWQACERGQHERALELIDRGLVVCDARFDQARDTKVRALLGLGRSDEAYRIVREVLERDPEFETFADVAASEGYRAWLTRS